LAPWKRRKLPPRRMNAVTLGDLNASSKTMNQNLKNGHAIAFGAHHCGRVGKLLGVFFDRPRRARECHLQAKDGSPTIVAAGLAMLIRGGDGARLTMGGGVPSETTKRQGCPVG
jgi:hypothetical protein